MSGFSAEWLALREPYDRRARNAEVLDAVAAAMAKLHSPNIADLACGTGSTYRAVSPRLPSGQRWRLYDNDLSLLARAGAAENVMTVPLDLGRDLEGALDGPVDLVTMSALLDLVSEDWLDRLVTEAAARRLPVYAALSYNGRISFDPMDPIDHVIVDAVNAHQRTDKGFGPALGPDAAGAAIERFERLGYRVVQGQSDWVFDPKDRDIQLETLQGWAEAANELWDMPVEGAASWLPRRRRHVVSGRSTIRVGHVDFFAEPAATR